MSMRRVLICVVCLATMVGCQSGAGTDPKPEPRPTTQTTAQQPPEKGDQFTGVYTMILSNEQMKANEKLLKNGLPSMVGSLRIAADGKFEMSTSGGSAVITVDGHSEKDGSSIKLIPETVNGQKVTAGSDTNPTTFILDSDGQTLVAPEAKLTFRRVKT